MAEAERTSPPVLTERLGRSFGKVRALDGFDMQLPRGQVVALVGPNGAGKTTLLLILAGLLQQDAGTVRIGGLDPAKDPEEVHRRIGWMPDFFGVYDDLTATEYLELFAAAYRIDPAAGRARAVELLELVGLQEFATAKVHTMSRGQKQRLGFARVLVHRPEILLLDEPASGLDPRARVELRDLVRAEASRGVTVMVSSHILSELEEMSDLVVFAEGGRSRGMFPLDALPQGRALRAWRIKSLNPDVLRRSLRSSAHDVDVSPEGGATVMLQNEAAAGDLLEKLIGDGVRVSAFAPQASGLEGAFMSLDDGMSLDEDPS